MSEKPLATLAQNINRLINKSGGMYSSNEAAQKASQGLVSRSTFDRLRRIDRAGATSVGVDKLEGVAKTFGVKVWHLFVPNLNTNSPPKLTTEVPDASPWPFAMVDEAKVRSLSPSDLAKLEAAIILGAAQLGIDIKAAEGPKDAS